MISRRVFVVSLCGGLLAAPLAADAQQTGKVPRIGVLIPGSPSVPSATQAYGAFQQGLRDLGYVEGQTLRLESRWEEGNPERIPALVAELVRLNVDVIVAGTTPTAVASKQATRTIPIVIAAISDPVGSGLVASLSRPGGNVTGMSLLVAELSGKRLEMLKEVVPRLSKVAIVANPRNPASTRLRAETEAAAQSLGIQFRVIEASVPADLDRVFPAAVKAQADALLLLQSAMFSQERARIADLALKRRLPTMSGETGYAQAGGLMNYGPNIPDSWRRSAAYVDKILRGAKPSDLPVEQPTKFELVINLKTARALGLTIPPALLARADEVIE